eukprot:TRINITY_DN2619_c0_g1_i1.p1 TRINITY_DN2619_c0_g1~~TRINITY_DN2619_c0_g1_i1.p1  ORF type:complete len:466 (+),score=66.94 TRINITY_DN2619_c0_g1_i1:196-1593(+)
MWLLDLVGNYLLDLQVFSVFAILILALIFGGFVPYRISQAKHSYRDTILSLGNCFAGGVFLSVGFVHVLPDSTSAADELGLDSRFGLPYLFAMGGLMFVLFIEKVLLGGAGKQEEMQIIATAAAAQENEGRAEVVVLPRQVISAYQYQNNGPPTTHCTHDLSAGRHDRDVEQPNHVVVHVPESPSEPLLKSQDEHDDLYPSIRQPNANPSSQPPYYPPTSEKLKQQQQQQQQQQQRNPQIIGDGCHRPRRPRSRSHGAFSTTSFASAPSWEERHELLGVFPRVYGHAGEHKHLREEQDHHQHHHIQLDPNRPMVPYVLAVVLSIHSIFGGLALGIQPNLDNFLVLFLALLLHKTFEAFAFGTSFVKQNAPFRRWIGILIVYSLATPIGIAIGAIALRSLNGDSLLWTEMVVNGLSSGTFIYVGVVDILCDELDLSNGSRTRLMQWFLFFAVICGAALMYAVTFLE